MKPKIDIIDVIKTKIKAYSRCIRIIFPEGNHPLIQAVALELVAFNITPLLIFKDEASLKAANVDDEHIEKHLISDNNLNDLAGFLTDLRRGKLERAQANKLVQQPNYFSVLQVKLGRADGMVGGITYDTSDIIRPALQIIKTRPGIKLVSSAFLMVGPEDNYIFTDCALNIAPKADELATIGELAYEAAQIFQFDNPIMAFLSFSTTGSGKGPQVDVVREAIAVLKQRNWNKCPFDGEFQFDSALLPKVRQKKAPSSKLPNAPTNIYVFPNLDAGNIGYKIAQRLGGMDAIGPILLGLDKPVNDLSRGASADDILKTALVTAYNYILTT